MSKVIRGLPAIWALASLITAALCAAAPMAHATDRAQTDDVKRDDKPAGKSRADALLDMGDAGDEAPSVQWHGFYQLEGAYTLPKPAHGSKLLNRFELGAQGSFSDSVKWRIGGRLNYDAIFDLNNYYTGQVRDDQHFQAMFRETYLDFGAGDLEFRVGRQQIVWGEVVGLFFADVVSAKDLREFILPDFDILRIPQWAGRAEYFKNDVHLEAIWIPLPTVDNIGKPGAEFYPYPVPPTPGYGYVINNERKPERKGANQNFGMRASVLKNGWDVAGFAYRSVDAAPTFFREIVNTPSPALVYTPRHEKITQYGLTFAKDLRNMVLKGEAVYTRGKRFNVTRLDDADGVVRQDYLDYIVSLEFPLPEDARFNLQFFQRRFSDHDRDILPAARESGVSLYWSGKWASRFEPQLLFIHSLNRNDWMLRPRLIWNFEKNWRAAGGADFFGGRPTGLFGQFDKKDRVYLEVRRSF